MKQILIIIITIVGLTSCMGKDDLQPSKPSDQVMVDTTQMTKKTISEEINTSDSDVEEETRNNILKYTGTYLPEIYINKLIQSKSHLIASETVNNSDIQYANALMLDDIELMKIYNFHEGVGESVVKFTQDTLITKNGGLIRHEAYGNDTIYDQKLAYKKISEISEHDGVAVGKYLVKTIFGIVDLKNEGSEFKTTENGTIIYKGNEFTYGVGLVFTSLKYDYISSSSEIRYIETLPDRIRIYTGIIPDEFADDPFGIQKEEYTLENEFEFTGK